MSKRSTQTLNTADQEEDAAIVGVDLGKTVFQLCIADRAWRVTDAQRLSRTQFERYFVNRKVALVVMEASPSSHHWARWMAGLGRAHPTPLHAPRARGFVRGSGAPAFREAGSPASARACVAPP